MDTHKMALKRFGTLVRCGDEYVANYGKTYFCIENDAGQKLIMSYKFHDIEKVKMRCRTLIGQTVYYSTWDKSTWSEYEWFEAVYSEGEAAGEMPW